MEDPNIQVCIMHIIYAEFPPQSSEDHHDENQSEKSNGHLNGYSGDDIEPPRKCRKLCHRFYGAVDDKKNNQDNDALRNTVAQRITVTHD